MLSDHLRTTWGRWALYLRYIPSAAALLMICPVPGYGQTTVAPATGPQSISFGGAGWAWMSQFANPALVGSLYMTPDWPMTGYYPLFPGAYSRVAPGDGVTLGPVRLHPSMGIAELYTDNVFRTNTNRQSDFATTLAPAIQAEVPFAGSHTFIADYRTNIQFFNETPSNNVQDQTASGRFNFSFPGGLQFDLQGEHKLGHDPRGSALDTQNFDINKWTANSVIGRAAYDGANAGISMNLSSIRWTYLNNDQGVFRDRLSNYLGTTFRATLTGKTSALVNVGVNQELYDQTTTLNSTTYSASAGLRWNVTDVSYGEVLGGYQYLKFNNASTAESQSSAFARTADSYGNFFFMGNFGWTPTPFLTVAFQGYRTFQQTVVFNSLFFTATGANLSAVHELGDRAALTLNMGLEHDDFQSSSDSNSNRVDLIKSVSAGIRYRALKWVGAGLQYVYENRSSTSQQFEYYANTVMLSLQASF